LQKYVNSFDDQVDMVYTLQEACEEDEHLTTIFGHLMKILYDLDITEEDAVIFLISHADSVSHTTLISFLYYRF
jgi:hypothetical protein